MKFLFLPCLLLVLCIADAQEHVPYLEPPSHYELLWYDGGQLAGGVLNAYTGPARWEKQEWFTAGGIALGTIGLYLVEERLQPHFVRRNAGVPDWVQDAGFYFGKPQYNYGLTAAIYTFGWLTRNDKVRETGVLLIASATTAGLLQTVSKTVVGRARPSTGLGNSTFDLFNGTPDYHSFPSGHAILAFTTAHALAKQTRSPWLKAGIYTLGSITPLSRLWTDAHWLSDIGLSLAISVVAVDSVYNYLQQRKGAPSLRKHNSISWKVKANWNGVGLVGTF